MKGNNQKYLLYQMSGCCLFIDTLILKLFCMWLRCTLIQNFLISHESPSTISPHVINKNLMSQSLIIIFHSMTTTNSKSTRLRVMRSSKSPFACCIISYLNTVKAVVWRRTSWGVRVLSLSEDANCYSDLILRTVIQIPVTVTIKCKMYNRKFSFRNIVFY